MRLDSIDRLRGIAILAVIWHHVGSIGFAHGAWLTEHGLLAFPAAWIKQGWMGVNLFFILSGFVLYLPFATQRRQLRSRAEIAGFVRHRALRLLPLYYLSTALLLVFNFQPSRKLDVLTQTFTLATVTFNFSSATFFPAPNSVLWSLGIEVWFTLAFIALVLWLGRFRTLHVALPVFAVALAVRLLGTYLPGIDISGSNLNPIRDSLLGRIDDFLVGMLIALWFARRGDRPALDARSRALLITGGLVLATVAAALWDTQLAGFAVPKWQVAIANNVFQAGIALVLVAVLQPAPERATNPLLMPVQLAGMMCYSLYIWHGVISEHLSTDKLSPFAVTETLVAVGVVAWLSYRYIEFGTVADWRQLIPHHEPSPPAHLRSRQLAR